MTDIDIDPASDPVPAESSLSDEELQEAAGELVQIGLQLIQSAANTIAEQDVQKTPETVRITVAQHSAGFVAAVETKPGVEAAGIAAASATAFRADTIFAIAHVESIDLRDSTSKDDTALGLSHELICVASDRDLGSVELSVRYGFVDGQLQFGEGVVRPSDFSELGTRIAIAVSDVLAKPYEELPDWIIMEDYYEGVASTFRSYGLRVMLDKEL